MSIKINFFFKAETKTCYRFETGERPDQMTLYLKKKVIEEAGIDPQKGITVTVEERS
ncbi:MAG: hypothetical protein GXW96_09495 [Christensenellaceae bacterium]|nr:hypothetical protein [Christensenellaceae bacterium]